MAAQLFRGEGFGARYLAVLRCVEEKVYQLIQAQSDVESA